MTAGGDWVPPGDVGRPVLGAGVVMSLSRREVMGRVGVSQMAASANGVRARICQTPPLEPQKVL